MAGSRTEFHKFNSDNINCQVKFSKKMFQNNQRPVFSEDAFGPCTSPFPSPPSPLFAVCFIGTELAREFII